MAEESSQPAFQSIEAFVRSFSSMTMMLESSYQAMHMSFRAILSVADNMSRLRSVIGKFFSSLAVLRLLHWFYRKILHMLGRVSEGPGVPGYLYSVAREGLGDPKLSLGAQ
jgi:peroxin-13